jgi:iron complex outermembrane receptor protein
MKTGISGASSRVAVPCTILAATLAGVFPLHHVNAQTAVASAQLSPVMVSSTRFAEAADTLPFGVSVITAADIERAGVSTVNEAIIKLLGVPGRLDLYGGGDYGLTCAALAPPPAATRR